MEERAKQQLQALREEAGRCERALLAAQRQVASLMQNRLQLDGGIRALELLLATTGEVSHNDSQEAPNGSEEAQDHVEERGGEAGAEG